jgi:hypothetical protein
MYLNPVQLARQVTMERFLWCVQLAVILVLSGMCALALLRAGIPRAAAALVSVGLAFFAVVYLFSHRGNPFDLAERFCMTFGSVFRFAGGFGVAAGVVFLIGIRRLRGYGHGIEVFHPIVLLAAALYGVLCFESLRGGYASRSAQIGMALSVAAAWVSFGGIFGLVRHSCRDWSEARIVSLVAAGCLMLVFITYLHTPYLEEYRLLYSASFPAGVFVGAVTIFAWI